MTPFVLRLGAAADVVPALDLARAADRSGVGEIVVDAESAADVDVFVAAAAIAGVTEFARIGVVVSVRRWHPYLIARRLAELDKLSAGRLAWSAVDPDPERRDEAVGIVSALLTSWGPGAVVNDRRAGRQVDLARISWITMSGKHFAVDSPLDVPAGPQGAVPVFTLPAAEVER